MSDEAERLCREALDAAASKNGGVYPQVAALAAHARDLARQIFRAETRPPLPEDGEPLTDEQMKALLERWSFGPEQYQADADALIATTLDARAKLAAAERERDEAKKNAAAWADERLDMRNQRDALKARAEAAEKALVGLREAAMRARGALGRAQEEMSGTVRGSPDRLLAHIDTAIALDAALTDASPIADRVLGEAERRGREAEAARWQQPLAHTVGVVTDIMAEADETERELATVRAELEALRGVVQAVLDAPEPPGEYAGGCFSDCGGAGHHEERCTRRADAYGRLRALTSPKDGGQ